jgi:hypothetical protein
LPVGSLGVRAYVVIAGLVAAALGLAAGCKVTADDVDKYASAENGPALLGDAIASPGTDPAVQAKAIQAMAELGEWKELEAALTLLKEDGGAKAAAKAVAGAVARFEKSMESGDDAAKERAKDGLFQVRGFADDETRKRADDDVLKWLTADLSGRATKGAFSASAVVPAIGAPAVDALLKLLDPDAKDSKDLDKLSVPDLILKTATPAQKGKVAKLFVEFAKTLHPKLPRPVAAGLMNLGGKDVTDFLLATGAEHSGDAEARYNAMDALVKLATPDMRTTVERIALDAGATGGVRERALFILKNLKDPESLKVLYPLSTDTTMQGAMAEMIVGLGGKDHVQEWLESIPTGKMCGPEGDAADADHPGAARGCIDYPRGVVQYWGQDIGKGLGKDDALAVAAKLLTSKSWIARLTGVSIYEFNGGKADAATVKALKGDGAPVSGSAWEAGTTIGKEATRVANLLEAK